MPVCKPGVAAEIIRKGMDHYWRVVYSKNDQGLTTAELKWRRDHEKTMLRWEEKFGKNFDCMYGKL